jgi:hypothetical protein
VLRMRSLRIQMPHRCHQPDPEKRSPGSLSGRLNPVPRAQYSKWACARLPNL